MLGDAHRKAAAQVADRLLDALIGEGGDGSTVLADEVVVVALAGADRLVAGHLEPHLDFLHQTQPLELVEDAVDARAGGN